MRLLYWGALSWGSQSLARMRALSKLADDCYAVTSDLVLGEYVYRSNWQRLQTRLAYAPLVAKVRDLLLRECERYVPDIVWVNQGSLVSAEALAEIRARTGAMLVHYTDDSLHAPGMLTRVFRKAIPVYEVLITTKERELPLYEQLGARRSISALHGLDPAIHRPMALTPVEMGKHRCDVVLLGQAMASRAALVVAVANGTGAHIKVYGRGWAQALQKYHVSVNVDGWLFGDAYVRALRGAKVALGVLNESVGDQVTQRSFEIPACGVFMLAPRTAHLCSLFRESREAAYFSSPDELVAKVRHYLAHDDEREAIAAAGYQRVVSLGCYWEDRLKGVLEAVNNGYGAA